MESRFDSEVLGRAYEQVKERFPGEPLPGLRILMWEVLLSTRLTNITLETLELWRTKTTEFNPEIYNAEYRRYYDYPEVESGIPLVGVSSYIKFWTKDVYYGYSNTWLDTLIRSQKVDEFLKKVWGTNTIPLTEADSAELAIDTSRNFPSEKQKSVVEELSKKLGYTFTGTTLASVHAVRRVLSLHYGNQQLRKVFREKQWEIRLRKPVAEALQKINTQLESLGYSIWLDTGHRSAEEQKVIKENHARTFWQADADTLFANEGKSAHNIGWALDVVLYDTKGKRINLAIGDNSPKTKTSTYGEELIQSWVTISEKDMEAIKWRRMLHHIMTTAGFSPLHTEYWHFDAPWDRLYGYFTSKRWEQEWRVPGPSAFYGNLP
jgi:D-alanyl-D-alanine dipeptidase